MTSKELLNCLKDRPCSVCKFRDEHGCHKWTCVFEEETEDEPKKGEWITQYEIIHNPYGEEHNPHTKCSKCNFRVDTHSSQFMNFCPNCGADMRGKADD